MKQILAVIIMALVTYVVRSLPLLTVQRKIKCNFIRSFLFYVPFAVLGAMIFPSILYSTNCIASAIIGLCIAILLAYFEKNLMIVAVCAIVSVYICELFV